jgi:hypothetical protein
LSSTCCEENKNAIAWEYEATPPEQVEGVNVTAIDTTRPSLTIVKSFTYRGDPEEWSNTHFFTGTMPASPASWKTLADAVIADEVPCYPSSTEVVRAIGHQAGESVAVWSYDYAAHSESVAGTLSFASGAQLQGGDAAAWVRWSTDQLTSKGKPIYLRSYFHNVATAVASGDSDNLDANQAAALLEYGQDWIAGFADADAVNHTRCGPHGAVGLVALASQYVTTRTLERRGRRPT